MYAKNKTSSGFIKPVLNICTLVDRNQLGWFLLMLFVLVTAALVTLGFGILLKGIVDEGFSSNNVAHLNRSLICLLGMVGILGIASFARLAISGWLSEQMVSKLRTNAYAHLLTLDPGFFQRRHSAEVASALTADISTIGTVIATSLPLVARHTIMVLGGFTMLMITSPHLTLLVMGVLPLVAVPVVVIGKIVRKKSKAAQEHAGILGGMVGETLSSIQTVQSYTAEKNFLDRFLAATADASKATMQQVYSRSIMVSSIIVILFASLCAVMWVGAKDVMQGNMSAGSLTSFVFYAGVVASAFGVLGDMGSAMFRAAAALDRIKAILAEVPSITNADNAFPNPKIIGSIQFENVSFQYDLTARFPALDSLEMSIRAGETVAIVGDSGAGKTTLFQLLMRFHDPLGGRILLDGQDIRTLDLYALRGAISYVPQDSALFSGTVRDNIKLGDLGATEAEIIEAAKQAQAHEFISALPQGYDTPLGERGQRLSGGQKQRIALARALLKKAPVLLLDEATAALDTGNEKAIQDAVRSLHGKRTVLIIAHRLSTVTEADKIFVLHNGKVLEQGNHSELIAKGGAYARMVARQFMMAEDKARREYPDLTGSIQ